MRRKDTFDGLASSLAVASDAAAVFGGFIIAAWIRFSSGWIPFNEAMPPPRAVLISMYGWGSVIATVLFLIIFRTLGLYIRPQVGAYSDKIPRLVRGVGLWIIIATAMAFAIRLEPPYPPFSRLTVLLALGVVTVLVLFERYLLFRWEIHAAHHGASTKHRLDSDDSLFNVDRVGDDATARAHRKAARDLLALRV